MFGELVRAGRRRLGLTQEGLAAKAGLSTRNIRDIERGRVTSPRAGTVRLLAEALELTGPAREEFFELADAIHPEPALPAAGAATRPPAVAVPRQLPPRQAVLVGRWAELSAVGNALAADATREAHAVVVAIHGPGGVGKSALAIAAGHASSAKYPDGQLYVDLHGATAGVAPLTPLDVIGRFLRSLGVPANSVPTDEAEALGMFRSWTADAQLLILADNAAGTEQIAPLIPANAACAVIVTSRRVLGDLAGARHVPIEPLHLPDAVELLTVLSRRRDDPGSAAAVAQACHGLPLALSVVGARLVGRPDWSFADMARRLSDEERVLDELEDQNRGIRPSLAVSYRELAEGPGAPGELAARALRAVGVLGLPTVGHDLVAAVLGIDPDGAVAALDRLVDARMIDSRGERYGMHDLIRLFAADLAHRTEPAAVRSYTLRTAISWYALTARRASELLRPQMRFAAPLVGVTPVRTGLADAADAMAWLDAEHSNCVQLVRRAVGPDTGLAALGAQVVLALYPSLVMRSYSHDWDVLCQLVLDAEDRVGEPMVTARVLTYRAFSLRGQLRLDEAVSYLDRALSIQRTVGDTVGESTTQDVLGMVLVSRGEFERSLRHFDRALDLRRQNGPALAEAVTLSNAAEPLARLGRFTEALSYLERSLEIRREHDDRGGEAVTLSNLAEVHLLRGDLDRTLNYADLALTASRDGGDRELERRALVLGARTLLRMNRGADMHHRIDQALDVAAASGGLFDGSDLRELAAELRAAGHRASAERIGVQLEALRVRT